jgi:flagellar motility protein MotE (MotC chaperone)
MRHAFGASLNGYFMNRLIIGAFGLLLTASLIGWQAFSIKALRAEVKLANERAEQLQVNRDELAASLADSERDKKELWAEFEENVAVLASRDAELKKSRQELAELSETLRGLRKHDEEYKKWSDARVPDAVIRLLRNTRAKGDSEDGVP